MAISKIVYKSSPSATPVTWMDATTATAAAADIISPKTAMLANGVVTTGTGSGGGGLDFDDFVDPSYPSGAMTADSATSVGAYTCANRTGITSVTSSTVTTIREYAFQGCTGLTSVSLPNLVYMRNGASGTNTNANGYFFSGCGNKIESVDLKNLEYIYGSYAFQAAFKSGAIIVLPKLRTGSQRCFRSNSGIIVDLGPYVDSLLADFMYQGSGNTLILRKTGSIVTAASDGAIGTVSTLYVPSALVSSYQTADYWKTRYSGGTMTINAIENSQYDGYYADGTAIS